MINNQYRENMENDNESKMIYQLCQNILIVNH